MKRMKIASLEEGQGSLACVEISKMDDESKISKDISQDSMETPRLSLGFGGVHGGRGWQMVPPSDLKKLFVFFKSCP